MILKKKIQSDTWTHPPTSIVISDFWIFLFFAQPISIWINIFFSKLALENITHFPMEMFFCSILPQIVFKKLFK